MRRAFLATLTLAALVMFAGCSDQEPTSPAEPSFGKRPSTDCLDGTPTGELRDVIRAHIGEFFADRKTKKAAGGQINNIERKLCKDPLPQYDDATNMAWDFLRFTNDKIPNKFDGDAADAAALTSKVFALAADPAATKDPPAIPSGAFLPTGGVNTFDPADASPEHPIIASTENEEAAVVIDNPDAFPPGTGMVTIVLSREDGDVVVEPGGFIPGFQAYEEGYQILSSHQPDPNGGGVIIALCVVPETAPADLVIGHLHDSSVELLVPTDPNPEFLNYIDCTNATATTVVMNIVAPPGWLQYARRLVQPVVQLFEPKPLNAMLFRGRGLGGRTTSLSLDAPVDPTIDVGETVQLSVGDPLATWNSGDTNVATVDGTGLVTGVAPGTATITADFPSEESLSMVITVEAVGGDMIVFSSGRDGNTEIYVMNLDVSGQTNLTNDSALDGCPAWSPDGSKIAFCSDRTASTLIHVMNADGTLVSAGMGVSGASWPSWSPDGTKIAYSDLSRIHTMNADGTSDQTLTTVLDAWTTAWSPDGTMIATSVGSLGARQIVVMNSDGSGTATTLTTGFDDTGPVWSPDGTKIVFGRAIPSGQDQLPVNPDIYVMNADGTGVVQLTTDNATDLQPAWSPDGTKIVFWSSRTGSSLIYVMNADGTGLTSLTSLTGSPGPDFDPEWQPQLPIVIIID